MRALRPDKLSVRLRLAAALGRARTLARGLHPPSLMSRHPTLRSPRSRAVLVGALATSAALAQPRPALATVPEKVSWTSAVGTSVPDLQASSDGRWVALLEEGSGEVRFLDTWSWSVEQANAPCVDAKVTAQALWEDDTELRLYVGCSDSTVRWLSLVAGDWTSSDESVELDGGEVLGMAESNGAVIIVAAQADEGGNPMVHHLDPTDGGLDETGGYPETLGYNGFVDLAATDAYVVVAHGGDNVSKIDVATGSPTVNAMGQSSLDAVDVILTDSGTFLISGGQAVVDLELSTNDLALAIDSGDGIEDVGAGIVTDDGDSFLLADGGRGEFLLFTMGASSGLPGDEEQDSFAFPDASSGALVRELVSVGEHLVAGTESGEVWVLGAAPWVEASVSPGTATSGEVVTVSFTSDEDGDWEVRFGGEGNDDGELVDSGELVAGAELTAELTVDADWVEGDNAVRVVVTDSDGNEGHDVGFVEVDNPPGAVSLSDASLGFGNSQLTLTFEGLEDADLDYYTIYITTSPFEPDDYETGGPAFDGDEDLDEDDLTVDGEPGATVIQTLSPLTNGVVYYVAVRATDAGGQEGPMSDVVSASPQETFGAAARAGEQGGMCGTVAPASVGLVILAGLAALGRRRGGAAAVLAGGLGLGLVGTAEAAEDVIVDKTKTRGSVSLRAGPIALEDSTLTDVFGETGNEVIWLEGGPAFGSVLELHVGMGWLQEMGWLLTEDGAQSDEHDMLTCLPFTAGATLRLDVLEEQILVPVVSAGGDYWLWRENWYVNPDVGGSDRIGGAKYGWHWAVGGQLLLDSFEPRRASKLQARTGIDDSYLVFEYRDQTVGDWQSGLNLGGTSWSLGLKVRY